MTTNILVIPDPHDQPNTDKSRFTILGNLIVKKQPEVIICLGDFAEMGSLSQYDVGKVSAEGKRYADDLKSCHEALESLETPIREFNEKQKLFKKKQYNPRKIMILGNHDGGRIEAARQKAPKFYDTISVDDLKYKEYGWEVAPMTDSVIVEDISFSHFCTSGVMGKPIGGANHARNLLLKNHMSTIVGHSHLIDYSIDKNGKGEPLFGLVAGCYFDYDQPWTTENDRYNRGLVYLHDCTKGWGWPEFLGMNHLQEKYS